MSSPSLHIRAALSNQPHHAPCTQAPHTYISTALAEPWSLVPVPIASATPTAPVEITAPVAAAITVTVAPVRAIMVMVPAAMRPLSAVSWAVVHVPWPHVASTTPGPAAVAWGAAWATPATGWGPAHAAAEHLHVWWWWAAWWWAAHESTTSRRRVAGTGPESPARRVEGPAQIVSHLAAAGAAAVLAAFAEALVHLNADDTVVELGAVQEDRCVHCALPVCEAAARGVRHQPQDTTHDTTRNIHDKAKAARRLGDAVEPHDHPLDQPTLGKQRIHLVFGGVERQVANVQHAASAGH